MKKTFNRILCISLVLLMCMNIILPILPNIPLPDFSKTAQAEANAPHEANFLKLDCSKVKATFGWKPRWHIRECMEKTCAFSKVWLAGGDIPAEMDREINEFFGE